MKNRKKAMRKFRKKSIVAPILGFVFGVVFMMIITICIGSAEVAKIAWDKINDARKIGTLKVQNIIDNLDEYDNDMQKALDNSETEIIIVKDGQKVYYNTDADITEDYLSVEQNEDEFAIFYSEEDLSGMKGFGDNALVINEEDKQVEISPEFILAVIASQLKDENFSEEETPFEITVWVPTDVRYEDGVVLVHSEIDVNREDVELSIFVLVAVMFLFVVITISLLVNIFSFVRNNNKMLDALYFDDKTLTNNWLYLTTKAEKMIRKKSGIYAFISVKCCRYEHCKACSGVAIADNLILNSLQEIKKLLTRKDLIARNSDSYIGIVVKRNKEEEIKLLVDNLLSSVSEEIYVGVYILTRDKNVKNNKAISNGIEDYCHYAKLACESVNESDEIGVAYFDEKLKEQNIWINNVETELDAALENEEFVVYIQPKYSPADSSLKGAEALIRWNKPETGIVPPGKFIPICESNGSIVKIDDYMLSHVAKLQSEWIEKGYSVVPVSVNVSRIHFMNPNLTEHICELVDKYNTPHNTIEIELTESAFFDDKKVLLDTVKKLQDSGFQVSMDDFGSGYSSLNSLKDLTLDVLKLDADFFRGESSRKRGELIVSKAIELAKALQMEIVAEGVEFREQVDFLAQAGCDMIQGYYYDKPMPTEEFETRMTK